MNPNSFVTIPLKAPFSDLLSVLWGEEGVYPSPPVWEARLERLQSDTPPLSVQHYRASRIKGDLHDFHTSYLNEGLPIDQFNSLISQGVPDHIALGVLPIGTWATVEVSASVKTWLGIIQKHKTGNHFPSIIQQIEDSLGQQKAFDK
jgi:hypothetical protein